MLFVQLRIAIEEQDEYKNLLLLKSSCVQGLMLRSSLEHKRFFSELLHWKPKKAEPIIDEVPQKLLRRK
jgi:hypothetical protein